MKNLHLNKRHFCAWPLAALCLSATTLQAQEYDNERPDPGLQHLGIHTGTQRDHQNHFHIDLRRPDLVKLTRNLITEGATTNPVETIASAQISIAAESLLNEILSELHFTEGDMSMFLLDTPATPPQHSQMLLVHTSKTSQSAPTLPKANRIGVCALVESPIQIIQDRYSAINSFGPIGAAITYLENFEGRKIQGSSIEKTATSTVLMGSNHGTLEQTMPDPHHTSYVYVPRLGFLGNDRATFLVKVGARELKVEYFFKVLEAVYDDYTTEQFKQLCAKGELWRISSNTDFSTPYLTFADLRSGSVGQATSNSITLDTNAADHGWFVDTTPDDNEEFLATSDPNIWIARAGSAADGKMDMLSVLLHEYGHVLGLDHSGDNDDAMAVVLQPGVRKLWSETDLAKLNEIKHLQYTQSGQLPADFPVDSPSDGLPPGQTRASTPVSRRPRRDANLNNDWLSDAKIEALNAINPTLIGGDLLSPLGWDTTGAVSIVNGRATLSETTRSQSRLSQGFVLSSLDRYLSFTVEGLQMTDSTVGPDDAFEVALLNANTRAALTSTVALTRTDSLLNIQANGTEKRSDKLRRIDNADGSRTYVLDLLGVGTTDPVALSFDLIGFGAADSQVTIRDVRLSGEVTATTTAATDDGLFSAFGHTGN